MLPTVFVTPPTVLPKVSPKPPRSPAIDVWLVGVRALGLGVGVWGTYGFDRWTWWLYARECVVCVL